jgi:hypothetical protein
VLAGYLAFVGGVVALELVAAVGRAQPPRGASAFERALRRRRPRATRPDELTRLENQVRLATVTALDAHRRLRPLLREAAAHRLRVRHGIDLDGEPARARALLGDEVWELVRPGVRPPADRKARGVSPARLARVLDAIEAA